MGFYLNPGNDGFWESIRSQIYVDKTGLIAHTNGFINTKEKFICVSRPRRFGKSMALEMLAAYYSRGCDSRNLFSGKIIETDSTFDVHLNQYDVILLNMQQFLIEAPPGGITELMEKSVLEELLEEYGQLLKEPAVRLAETYEALKIYMDMDIDGLQSDIVQMLGGSHGCFKGIGKTAECSNYLKHSAVFF